MRSRSMVLALSWAGILMAVAAARAEDDPVLNGIKLSAVIAKFNATNSNDENSVNERSELAQTIARYDSPKALAFLGTVLRQEKSPLVKVNTALALATLGPKAKSLVPDLIAVLKDKNASVRAEAAGALGSIGPDAKAAAPDLLAFLKDQSQPTEVRAASALALAGVGAEPKEATSALKEALKDKNIRLRMACASALYALDKANAKLAVPVLREGMKNEETQMLAVLSLGVFGSDAKEAVPDLIDMLKKGGVGGYYAPETLAKIPEAEAALLAALKDPDAELRKAAAAALKKGFPEAAKKAGLIK